MRIVTSCDIDSAHFLPNYNGKCHNVHGHRWHIEIELDGAVKEDGMLWDFSEIRGYFKQYDHVSLNDYVENPTAENLAILFASELKDKALNQERLIKKVKVRVFEAPNSYAEAEV